MHAPPLQEEQRLILPRLMMPLLLLLFLVLPRLMMCLQEPRLMLAHVRFSLEGSLPLRAALCCALGACCSDSDR